MSQPQSSTGQATPPAGASDFIGKAGEDVLALAFAGGGFDTAMQLGVIHALLVSGGRPPDVVTGISAGAVNAVALADVFQAGRDLPEPERLAARVARLREILESFQQTPELLYNCLLPDPYEVEAHQPLKPVELPIHHKEERKFREEFSRERSGLIALINDLLAIRLPVRIITQVVRRVLAIVAASDQKHWWQRQGIAIHQGIGLWWTGLKHLGQIAPLFLIFLRAWWTNGFLSLPRPIRDLLRPRRGTTAGGVVLRSRFLRTAGRGLLGAFGFLVTALLWLFPVVLLLSLLYLLPDGTLHKSVMFLLGYAGEATGWTHRLLLGLERWLNWAAYRASVPWFALLALTFARKPVGRRVSEVLLRRYNLVDSLASPHPLRQMFVRLFDPVNYYGPIELGKMLDAALRDAKSSERDGRAAKKTLAEYFSDTGIFVAPVAADIKSGALMALPQEAPVVDALLAAMAVVPLFPAQELRTENGEPSYYIDGINIANEPTSVLVELLRAKIHPEARRVKIFAVSALPVSRSSLPCATDQYEGLMPVVQRVLALKRFRDASLERRLTQLHTRVADEHARRTGDSTALQGSMKVLRADFHSIEPDQMLDLSSRLARADSGPKRRDLILEAVAEGCRSALEIMIQDSIPGDGLPGSHSCWRAIASRLGDEKGLPGSQRRLGPGLVEVCQACALNRAEVEPLPSLRVPEDRACSPWPRENGPRAPVHGREEVTQPQPKADTPQAVPCDPQPPQVALLFSGGVFRGVFQMGAIAALSELDARPQIFAGASVGSITAAMAARVFATQDGTERKTRIALLAATFLTLDRLVLTDRFADFVRRFTLRAGASDFSVADADRFLRRYDTGSADDLSGSARKVMAGLERLLYLTPFELLKLVQSLRLGESASILRQLTDAVQDFLDRFEVGHEVLGAEPLAFLIAQHVLTQKVDPYGRQKLDPCETFAAFTNDEATLLAVSTNLTKGLLEILPGLDVPISAAEGQSGPNTAGHAVLLQSLLASSAFPAVFRPRWSWEVFPRSSEVCQYVDGGVMDNLPLDAVVQFLNHKVVEGKLAPRPVSSSTGEPVPHLLFAASLEPKLREPKNPEGIARNWPALLTRAGQLGYNRKIDGFRKAQHRFRALWKSVTTRPGEWQPLDIEVVTVKPEWLCGTFAFHPMLGFRRKKQAENIAHGCAMTLGTLYAMEDKHPGWFEAWHLKSLKEGSDNAIEKGAVEIRDADDLEVRLYPQVRKQGGQKRQDGECWFRSGAQCPFAQARVGPGLDTIPKELHRIYQLCGKTETHRPPKGLGRLYKVD